jgi:hypothetical protein
MMMNPLHSATDTLVSLAPTAGLGFFALDVLRLGLWAGVDVPLNRLSDTMQPRIDIQTDPARLLVGFDLELGLFR